MPGTICCIQHRFRANGRLQFAWDQSIERPSLPRLYLVSMLTLNTAGCWSYTQCYSRSSYSPDWQQVPISWLTLGTKSVRGVDFAPFSEICQKKEPERRTLRSARSKPRARLPSYFVTQAPVAAVLAKKVLVAQRHATMLSAAVLAVCTSVPAQCRGSQKVDPPPRRPLVC